MTVGEVVFEDFDASFNSAIKVPENVLPELSLSSLDVAFGCGLYDKVSIRFSLNVGFFFGSSGPWFCINFLRFNADLGVLALDFSTKESYEFVMRRTLMLGLLDCSMVSKYCLSGLLFSSDYVMESVFRDESDEES